MATAENLDELFDQLFKAAGTKGLDAATSKLRADGVSDELVAELVDHYKRYAHSATTRMLKRRLRQRPIAQVPPGDDIVDALVERYERHVGVVKEVRSPSYMQSGDRMTWYTGPRPSDPCWPKLVWLLEGSGSFDEDAIRELDNDDHENREPPRTSGDARVQDQRTGPRPRSSRQDDQLHRGYGESR